MPRCPRSAARSLGPIFERQGAYGDRAQLKPGFRINLHEKDLRNALLAAEAMKVSLPFTSLAQQTLIALMNDGKGNLDHSAIVTFIEHMAGIEVKKPQA